MTVSKIDFFDCLSVMQWTWREQSQSLFENLKTIELTLILYSWWERSSYEMHIGYVYKDNESLIGLDIFRNEISV